MKRPLEYREPQILKLPGLLLSNFPSCQFCPLLYQIGFLNVIETWLQEIPVFSCLPHLLVPESKTLGIWNSRQNNTGGEEVDGGRAETRLGMSWFLLKLRIKYLGFSCAMLLLPTVEIFLKLKKKKFPKKESYSLALIQHWVRQQWPEGMVVCGLGGSCESLVSGTIGRKVSPIPRQKGFCIQGRGREGSWAEAPTLCWPLTFVTCFSPLVSEPALLGTTTALAGCPVCTFTSMCSESNSNHLLVLWVYFSSTELLQPEISESYSTGPASPSDSSLSFVNPTSEILPTLPCPLTPCFKAPIQNSPNRSHSRTHTSSRNTSQLFTTPT